MKSTYVSRLGRKALLSLVMLGLVAAGAWSQTVRTSKPFTGVKANTGAVTATKADGRIVLTLSDDFTVPDTPDPHWQIVDSKGTVYLLERLDIKPGAMTPGAKQTDSTKAGEKINLNRTITLPSYVRDVAKVQIWCAFAEVLLGEAPFDKPVT